MPIWDIVARPREKDIGNDQPTLLQKIELSMELHRQSIRILDRLLIETETRAATLGEELEIKDRTQAHQV